MLHLIYMYFIRAIRVIRVPIIQPKKNMYFIRVICLISVPIIKK